MEGFGTLLVTGVGCRRENVWLYKTGLCRTHKSWMGKREAGVETWAKTLTIAYSHKVEGTCDFRRSLLLLI